MRPLSALQPAVIELISVETWVSAGGWQSRCCHRRPSRAIQRAEGQRAVVLGLRSNSGRWSGASGLDLEQVSAHRLAPVVGLVAEEVVLKT